MREAIARGVVFCVVLAGGFVFAADESKPAQPPQSFAERFASPPNGARMLKIVHGWPAKPEERAALIAKLQAQGYGGVVTNLEFHGGYTDNDAHFDALRDLLRRLRAAGMKAWLYDELGYPSGRAGTLVLNGHPELEAKGLLIAERRVAPGPVEIPLPPGQLLLSAAYRLHGSNHALDPADRVELKPAGGKIAWTAPAGDWRLIAISVGRLYDGTQVAVSGHPDRTAYVNLLETETTRRFLALTHHRYAAHLGNELRQSFTATFTDEPSTMAMCFTAMPYAMLPWCSDFADEFRRRCGYELVPELPRLVAESGERGRRVRCDYYRTVSQLMIERWWEPIRGWCKSVGVPSGGHLLLEENILHHVPLYGDAFAAFRHMDSPGIDCLSSDPRVPRFRGHAGMGADIPWNAARLASSAAELDRKPLVMCEVSEHIQNSSRRPITLSPEQYRGAWNRLLLGGINVLTSYHSFRGCDDAAIRRANDYLGRAIEAIGPGRRAAQVAVLYPIESVWARFTPSPLWVENASRDCKRIEETLRDLSEALYANRREFDYIDNAAVVDGRVESQGGSQGSSQGSSQGDGAALRYHDHAWRCIVLPECDTLPMAVWKKLEAFQQSGGLLVLLGAKPLNASSAPSEFPSPDVFALGERMLTGPRPAVLLRAGETIEAVRRIDKSLSFDLAVPEPDAPIRMTRRKIEGADVWWIVNDSPRPWSGEVTLPLSGRIEIADPIAGQLRTLPAAGPAVPLTLPQYGAVVLRVKPVPRMSPKR